VQVISWEDTDGLEGLDLMAYDSAPAAGPLAGYDAAEACGWESRLIRATRVRQRGRGLGPGGYSSTGKALLPRRMPSRKRLRQGGHRSLEADIGHVVDGKGTAVHGERKGGV
jgi:hypothetical protein